MARRLTAILSADIHDDSRGAVRDEVETHQATRKLIGDVIQPLDGKFGESAPDKFVAAFDSVVHAVRSAVEIQTTQAEKNAKRLPEQRLQIRIGIELGEIAVDGEKFFGDAMRIAARLRDLSKPGGICISGKVHDVIIKNEIIRKLELKYEQEPQKDTWHIVMPPSESTLSRTPVTILYSEIFDYVQLTREMSESERRDLLTRYRQLFRQNLREPKSVLEERTDGNECAAVFTDPSAALTFAWSLHKEFSESENPFSLRMGISLGDISRGTGPLRSFVGETAKAIKNIASRDEILVSTSIAFYGAIGGFDLAQLRNEIVTTYTPLLIPPYHRPRLGT